MTIGTNKIKPIETIYNGYRFRSRLEARWAVFFDAAGIRYEYEPQGFELYLNEKLGSIFYLPDFYLPQFNCYVEIKPLSILEDGDALLDASVRCVAMFNNISCGSILCTGDPVDSRMVIGTNEDWPGETKFNISPCFFGERITDLGREVNIFVYRKDVFGYPLLCNDKDNNPLPRVSPYGLYKSCFGEPRMLYGAKLKARQARFEHGEKP